MKTGIELIAEERKEQIEKHFISVADDVRDNNVGQLIGGARGLMKEFIEDVDIYASRPKKGFEGMGWNMRVWTKMMKKSYKARLIIAAALIASEIDRLQNK